MHLLLLFCAISFYSMISNFNTNFCQLSHYLYVYGRIFYYYDYDYVAIPGKILGLYIFSLRSKDFVDFFSHDKSIILLF